MRRSLVRRLAGLIPRHQQVIITDPGRGAYAMTLRGQLGALMDVDVTDSLLPFLVNVEHEGPAWVRDVEPAPNVDPVQQLGKETP